MSWMPALLFGLSVPEWTVYLSFIAVAVSAIAGLAKALSWARAKITVGAAMAADAYDRIMAMTRLAEAQLTTNGGGSLLDKVTATSQLIPELQRAIQENHDEARSRWDTLDGASKANKDDNDRLGEAVSDVRIDLAGFREDVAAETERRRQELELRRQEWDARFGVIEAGMSVLEAGARFWQLLGTELFNLAGPDDQARLQGIVDRIRLQIEEEGKSLPWPGG